MKKVLVVALVLAAASLANATLVTDISLAFTAPGVVTITGVRATTDYAASGFGIYLPGYASTPVISNPVALPAAGDLGAVTVWPGFNGFDAAPAQSGNATNVTAGAWFRFNYAGQAGDKVDVYNYAVSSDTPVGQLTITPEPMTMTLLGLGGLLFARKK